MIRRLLGFFCHNVCVASTCATSEAPTPNASAPSAPWVAVWLSPQTMTMPGWLRPCSGTDDVDDSLPPVAQAEQGHAGGRRVRVEILHHAAAMRLVDGGEVAAERRHVVVGRCERAIRPGDRQTALLEHAKGVARSVMDQMPVDMQQRVAVLPHDDGVRRPDLVEHGGRHHRHHGYSAASARGFPLSQARAHRVPLVRAHAGERLAHASCCSRERDGGRRGAAPQAWRRRRR